jgi:formate-dependent phosphoribosylglycinamide formyltransferase (GAR transformylase)
MTILGKYAELESHSDLGSDVVKSIEKVKGALMKISEAFRGHHRRLLEGDIMSLEAEIALLEKTASMEMNGE